MELKYQGAGATTPRSVSIRCPACGHVGTFVRVSDHQDIVFGPQGMIAGFRQCPNPDCLLFIYVVRDVEVGRVLFTEPREVIDFDATDVPDKVTKALKEAITCHANDCQIAAAMLVRKTLEELCADRDAKGKDLAARVKALGGKVILPPQLLQGLDELRLLGNDAAHVEARVYDEIGAQEVEVVIDFTKEVLKAVYQSDALLARLKSLRTRSQE